MQYHIFRLWETENSPDQIISIIRAGNLDLGKLKIFGFFLIEFINKKNRPISQAFAVEIGTKLTGLSCPSQTNGCFFIGLAIGKDGTLRTGDSDESAQPPNYFTAWRFCTRPYFQRPGPVADVLD